MLRSISLNFQRLFGSSSVCENQMTKKPLHYVETFFERATFGMGCFWGSESLFGGTYGVLRTRVGYSGGETKNPVYRNLADHTEVLEIEFDPKIVTFEKLLELFWNNHEYGLCTKIKRQYMSLILYHSEQQKLIAEQSLIKEQEKRTPEIIGTEIRPASIFYPAEDYHQKYRLQGHKELAKSLGLNSELLQKSHIAAKLNGYLAGVGGVTQFLKDAENLGLTESQINYVKENLEKNECNGLYC